MRPDEPRLLGTTGLHVSRTGLGTAALGGLFAPVGHAEAVATVRRALDLGISLVDTAPLYGHGLAEERVGTALAGVPPQAYTLSTKVGRLLRPGAPPPPPDQALFAGVPAANPVFDFSRDGVLRSVEESLERLGVGRIDVALVHDPDDHFAEAVGEAFPALIGLRDEGVVGAVGAGMNEPGMLTRFVEEIDLDVVLVAGRYTLLDQSAAADLLPACARRGVAVVAGGVYNSGVLARTDVRPTYDYRPAPGHVVARARSLGALFARHGVPLMAAAQQFVAAHPAVTSVLVGPRSVAELEQSVELGALPIPPAAWQELRAAGLVDERSPLPVT